MTEENKCKVQNTEKKIEKAQTKTVRQRNSDFLVQKYMTNLCPGDLKVALAECTINMQKKCS